MTAKKPEPASGSLTPEELADARAAEAWRPAEGESIRGTVVLIEKRESEWSAYPVVTIDTAEGFVNVHAFHSTLLTQLQANRPKPGSKMVITYHGRKARNKTEADGSKRTYHHYTVIDPDAKVPDYDWDADDSSTSEEPSF